MKNDNEQLLKVAIIEKDKVKLDYKQKLNEIMQHYGIEFDTEHFKNEKLKSIKFMNLKYKTGYDNLSVIYNAESKKIDYISYNYLDSRTIKNTNRRRFALTLEKDLKLKLIVSEIERANNNYIKEISKIDTKYQNSISNSSSSKVLQIEKNDEN